MLILSQESTIVGADITTVGYIESDAAVILTNCPLEENLYAEQAFASCTQAALITFARTYTLLPTDGRRVFEVGLVIFPTN